MSVLLSPREFEFSPEEPGSFGARITPVVPVPVFRASQHAPPRHSEPTLVVPNPALVAQPVPPSVPPASGLRVASPPSVPPAVEQEFWNATPRFPDSLPPPALISDIPRHQPSLLRRVLVSFTFGLCLVSVLGLLGFEAGTIFKHTRTVRALRSLVSMEFGI